MPPSPALVKILESVIYGGRKDVVSLGARGMLVMLSGLYQASVGLYLAQFKLGLRRRRVLDHPVISVGNLTVGGTGKTTAVRYICQGLADRQKHPAVLSYGYGGSLNGAFGVVADSSSVILTPDAAGDEPVMLACTMPGIPVLVGRDRYVSGCTAIDDHRADVLLLDDGFQVWKLHRDFDVVLANAETPFDNGRTLPAGRLRETPSAMRRADCVILTCSGEPASKTESIEQIRKITCAPIYFGRFKPSRITLLDDGQSTDLAELRDTKIFAISSVANPSSFEQTLSIAGATIAGTDYLPDHHIYDDADITRISARAVECGADLIMTTEKDAVKLQGRAFAVPVASLRIDMELDDEKGFWELAMSMIGKPRKF